MKYVALVMGAALFVSAGAAYSADGFDGHTNMGVKMFAGPSEQYPTVMRLSTNRPLTVYGCLQNMKWCDVAWRGNRGWVDGASVEISKGDHRVVVADLSAGVPTTAFSLKAYWDQNYRERPWYADRAKWFDAYAHGYADTARAEQTTEFDIGTQTAALPSE